jgi:hypothetical protein
MIDEGYNTKIIISKYFTSYIHEQFLIKFEIIINTF